MKIAYLIQIHNNPHHINKLIEELKQPNIDIFIHIDKKSKTKFNLPNDENVHILKNNCNVYWGEFSQVQASLLLLNEANQHSKYDYYVLLSGVDFPIKTKEYINKFFNKYKGNQFIDLYRMPLFDKSFDRLYYYRFQSINNKYYNFIMLLLNKYINKFNLKRRLPKEFRSYTLYAGANWWAFSSEFVIYLLNFVKNNTNFVNFFKNTLCADEMFFQIVLGNSKFKNRIMNSVTYADWSTDPKPNYINKNHFEIFNKRYLVTTFGNKRKYLLFARKFNDKSGGIIKTIISKYLK